MDSDMLALGNIESALDAFAPNSTAPRDLGAVRDIINGGRTFNAGFMAIQPSRSRFADMMRAGREMRFDGRYAEQGWLNRYFSERGGWTVLPGTCNMFAMQLQHGSRIANETAFLSALPRAKAIHYTGSIKVCTMEVRCPGRGCN
jgi:hypothetical protein